MIGRLFHAPSRTIASAAFLLAFMALGSRFLGLFRDRILAGKFGAGDELDIYFAAFRIPDLIYNIIIAGAISSAFIPVFISIYTENKKQAWAAASNFLNIAILSVIIISAILAIAAPSLVKYVAPGFSEEKLEVTAGVMRIMFLSPIFLGLSAIISGILHSFKRFFAYALAPIFYNLGIIFGALVLVDYFGIYGLAWGVALGAFLHFAIQVPSAVFSGFSWQRIFDVRDLYLKKIFILMIPRAIGLGAFQINLWIITAVASTLAVGSVAIFNLANNLQYLPIGIVGISFATAAFPSLSYSVNSKSREEFIGQLTRAMQTILFFVLPLSVLMFVLRAHIVRIIFGTGEFGWIDTRLTAAVLGIFCFGITAHSLIPILSRAFYALHNTKIPVMVNSLGMLINILLSAAFVFWLFHISPFVIFIVNFLDLEGMENISLLGLPLAFSIAGILNLAILFFVLTKYVGGWGKISIYSKAIKIFIASIAAGLAAFHTLFFSASIFDTRTAIGLFFQAGLASAIAVFVYVLFLILLRYSNLSSMWTALKEKMIHSAPHA